MPPNARGSAAGAFGIITGLVEVGYVVKEKDGRRYRYHIQAHLPLPERAKPSSTMTDRNGGKPPECDSGREEAGT